MDLLGSGYVIDHCVAVFKHQDEEKLYRMYITECLYRVTHALHVPMSVRYMDINNPKPVDNRTPEDIVADITAKAGLKVVKKNERISPDGDAGN